METSFIVGKKIRFGEHRKLLFMAYTRERAEQFLLDNNYDKEDYYIEQVTIDDDFLNSVQANNY